MNYQIPSHNGTNKMNDNYVELLKEKKVTDQMVRADLHQMFRCGLMTKGVYEVLLATLDIASGA